MSFGVVQDKVEKIKVSKKNIISGALVHSKNILRPTSNFTWGW